MNKKKLFGVSFYGNFSAQELHYFNDSPYEKWTLDAQLIKEMASKNTLTQIAEFWYFGPQVTTQQQENSKTFGFDLPQERVGENYHQIVADSWFFVDYLTDLASEKRVAVAIDVDFLATLFDPRPIITALKRIALISAVDIFFIKRKGSTGTRVWNEANFKNFILLSGLEVIETWASESVDYIFHSRLEKNAYSRYLESIGFEGYMIDSNFLLITTEDASLHKTGGIGTYVANVKKLNPHCVVLFASAGASENLHQSNTVIVEHLIGDNSYEQMFDGDGLLEAVRTMLYTLPNLNICEFQDYQAIGFRLVQAKQAGGLPSSLALRAFLHGNLDYVKRAMGTKQDAIYSASDLKNVTKDRYIFEKADEVDSPSYYLLNMMQKDFGYTLCKPKVQRLPFDLKIIPELPSDILLSDAEEMVYIGKFSVMKGWPDFVSAITKLAQGNALSKVRKLFVLAPGSMPWADKSELERYCEVEHLHLGHQELIRFLDSHRKTALFCIPSGSENYPFVILEQALLGCRFIAYRQGGAIEVIDDKNFTDKYFSECSSDALAGKIEEVLALSNEEVQSDIATLNKKAWARQKKVNDIYKTTQMTSCQKLFFDASLLNDVTVATPVFNTNLSYIEDLAYTLLSSTLRIKEWIIVNDGSKPDYVPKLVELCGRLGMSLPIKLIHQENSGLAGARNAGLMHAKTRYVYFMDSDDMFLPHTLAHSIVAMGLQRSGKMLAVGGYAVYFESKEALPKNSTYYSTGRYWKPLGIAYARVLALHHNEFITANCLVDVQVARSIGGYDDSDKATWEDWAFFLKSTWSGLEILLLPWPGYLYRNTPGSMSKTYNQYFGIRRLVRNFSLVDRFEANALIGLIQNLEEDKIAALRKELDDVYRSNSWGITRPLRVVRGFLRELKSYRFIRWRRNE